MKSELTSFISSRYNRNSYVLTRGEREIQLLNDWMNTGAAEDSPGPVVELSLKDELQNCSLCGEVSEKKIGIGSGKSGVMLILHSPRLINKVEKHIMKNESIDLLKKMVKAVNMDFNDCYITNLVKCESLDPLVKPSRMVANCGNILAKEIKSFLPKIIIVFGDIIPLQKIIKESTDIFWYNIDHPITLIKNPELKRSAWNTLKMIIDKMKEIGIEPQ